jgi:hypothetical protein
MLKTSVRLGTGPEPASYDGPVIRRYFKDLNRFEAVVVMVVVCLAVVGIGRAVWSDPHEDGSPVPSATPSVKKLPVVVDSEEPALVDIDSERSEMGLPPPSGDAPLTEKVLEEIQEGTLRMAGIRAKVSAGCEGGEVTVKGGHKTLCTVTYQGVKLTWDVWVADAGDVHFIRYNVYPPDSGVLLAKAVYGRFFDEYHKTAKELRCDRIPPLKTVTLGADTGYECQYLDADGDSPRWVRAKVFLETVGPVFQEIE